MLLSRMLTLPLCCLQQCHSYGEPMDATCKPSSILMIPSRISICTHQQQSQVALLPSFTCPLLNCTVAEYLVQINQRF